MKDLKNDKLYCKVCNYSSRQLMQHIKAVHNLTVSQYREQFGYDCIMQIGFQPKLETINEHHSLYVQKGYDKIQEVLRLSPILNYLELKSCLTAQFLEEYDFGRQQRKLKKELPSVYNSIIHYTKELDTKLGYKQGYLIRDRIKFILDFDCDVELLKCLCGEKYSIARTCRKCKGGMKFPTIKWFIHKYGPEHEIHYQYYLVNREFNNYRTYSMISKELFDNIISKLDDTLSKHVFVGDAEWCCTLNKEERNQAHQNVYYLDFKIHNINIEFDSNFGRFPKSKEYMDTRDRLISNRGFSILRIEEFDYVRNKSETIQKCIDFINQNIIIKNE